MLLYLAVYYTFLTLSDKKIDRYVLVLLPALILLVSVLISDLGSKLLGGIVVLCLGFTVWVISVYYPVYSAYYSPLFGGTTKALDMGIYENNGEYFSDAARYLNTKGRDKSVFVPDGVESFLYYYKGNLQRDFDDTTDFVVRSIDIDRKNPTFEGCSRLEKTFGPTKTPVVFVYVCD